MLASIDSRLHATPRDQTSFHAKVNSFIKLYWNFYDKFHDLQKVIIAYNSYQMNISLPFKLRIQERKLHTAVEYQMSTNGFQRLISNDTKGSQYESRQHHDVDIVTNCKLQ